MNILKLFTTLLILTIQTNSSAQIVAEIIDTTLQLKKKTEFFSFTDFNDKLILTSNTYLDTSLWYYDGSGRLNGVYTNDQEVLPNYPVTFARSMPYPVIGKYVYFFTENAFNETTLYRWDGKNMPHPIPSFPVNFQTNSRLTLYTLNGKLYFTCDTTSFQSSLWEFNPNNNQYRRLTTAVAIIANMYLYDNKFYFLSTLTVNSLPDLNIYDPVNDINTQYRLDTPIVREELAFINGEIFARGNVNAFGKELYKFDTSIKNFRLVEDLAYSSASGINNPIILSYNNKIFFYGRDTSIAYDKSTLYNYDPIIDTIHRVFKQKYPPTTTHRSSVDAVCNNKLFLHEQGIGSGYLDTNADTIITIESPLPSYPTLGISTQVLFFKGYIYFYGVIISPNSIASRRGLFRIKDSATAISQTEKTLHVTLYPNPTNNNTTVDIKLDKATTISASITDMTGKLLYTKQPTLYSSGQTKITLDTDKLPPGSYVVVLRGQHNQLLWSGKLIKQ